MPACRREGRFRRRFWKRCRKSREQTFATTGKGPLEIYKEVLDDASRAEAELEEAKRADRVQTRASRVPSLRSGSARAHG